jgi:hypothetical protein
MTSRERVLAILNSQQPDRVPWFGDLDYWATALVGRGQKPQGFQKSPEYIDWHIELGVGFYLQGYYPFKTLVENCEVEEWKEGVRRYRQIATPVGTLRECWQWMPDDFTEGPIEHLVKSVSDLPAYQHLHANTRYEPDYDFARQRVGQLRQTGAGVMLAYLPKSPLMQMVALDAGIPTRFSGAESPAVISRRWWTMQSLNGISGRCFRSCASRPGMFWAWAIRCPRARWNRVCAVSMNWWKNTDKEIKKDGQGICVRV